MIELSSVTVDYPQATPLMDISVVLKSGCTAVTGPSGSGKSTLLRVISGQQKPTRGRVEIASTAVSVASWRSGPDVRVAHVPQDHLLVPFLSVSENLKLAAEMRGLKVGRDVVTEGLERVGLEPGFAQRDPRTLSGGEQARVCVARAWVCKPHVVVADEPTGELDAENSDRVAVLLHELGQNDGCAVVIATHDLTVAERADARLGLAHGRLTALP